MHAYLHLMRWHRPLPILLILWPTLWGLFIASQPSMPTPTLLIIFIAGVFIMRTAGCIFNDIADRNFDRSVERTKTRPLATGEIPVAHAYIVGISLLVIAFCLVLLLNKFTILLAFIGVALALTYPLFKRFFAIPQLMLGFAFNFGVIMAFSAVQNHVPTTAWLLYFASICWTIAYDTIYALADLPDDIKLNLHSSAHTFGQLCPFFIILFQSLTLGLLAIFAYTHHYNSFFYLALGLCAICFYQQYHWWNKEAIAACIRAFSANHWVGLIIFIAILIQN